MEIALIVAADLNNGIGKDNQLLCHLPNDLKYFKKITTGNTIIMGRNTFDSIGKPLPNRTNIVLSRSVNEIPGCKVFSKLEDALAYAREMEMDKVFIVGGDSVYKQSLALANKVYLTRIQGSFLADAFFPALAEQDWELIEAERHEADEKNPYAHVFETYIRHT